MTTPGFSVLKTIELDHRRVRRRDIIKGQHVAATLGRVIRSGGHDHSALALLYRVDTMVATGVNIAGLIFVIITGFATS